MNAALMLNPVEWPFFVVLGGKDIIDVIRNEI